MQSETTKTGSTCTRSQNLCETTRLSTPYLCHRLAKIDALNEEICKLREAKVRCQSEGVSAEERSAEMGKVLDAEQRTMDTLQWQLDKSRDKKVQADKSLHELDTQRVFNSKRLKGPTSETNQMEGSYFYQ